MHCEWGHIDCDVQDKKCHLCVTDSQFYVPKKIKKNTGLNKSAAKISKRQGSKFEYDNHNTNANILNGAASRMTPNSGAGFVKGDEEIQGIINIMEELKCSEKTTARGAKQFSIQKEWLDKLNRESKEADKEFWYLKFAFGNHEADWYVITESDIIMSMIYTMCEDRKKALLADNKIAVAEKRRNLIEAENTKLLAEIELLKAEIELLKAEKS